MAVEQADGLELEVVLVRPEPGDRVIGLGPTGDGPGGGGRLIVGVLDRFEPDPGAAGEAVRVRRAIADRKDVGEAGPAKIVDVDAVAARGPERP